MSDAKRDEKQVKREARQLWDEGRAALEAGDHRQAREAYRRVVEMAPETELGGKAGQELQSLTVDRWVWRAGVGATLLYGLGWLLARI